MFRITNSTLMDRKYPNALAYIEIEAVIRVKQKLWAVKIWAKMIWKQPSSFATQCCFGWEGWVRKPVQKPILYATVAYVT